MEKRTIFETTDKTYRILEIYDETTLYDLENLKGDCFNPEVNPDIDIEELKKQEKAFEKKVYNEGVYGYVLEKWNPEPGIGYEHLDSCWGFVGQYDENSEEYNHYIVEELMSQIPENLIEKVG